MSTSRDCLEHLIYCIDAKTDLAGCISRDDRFRVRLQQALRSCLGVSTLEAQAFMDSVLGEPARRAGERPPTRPAAPGATRSHPAIELR